MTTSPVCCKPSDRLDRVAELMVEHDCGVIPVCDGVNVVGILTDRDITCRAVATGQTPVAVPAADVMTKIVWTIRDDANAQAAIDLMKKKQVRRLPVLNDEGDLVGIISPSDLAPIFASMNVADFLLAVSYWSRRAVTPAA
jgi:CBS domain-containing protein